MRILYIYNPESENERNTLEQVTSELIAKFGDVVDTASFMDVKDIYTISQTPSVVISMNGLVSENLLNVVDGQFELTNLLDRINNLEFYTTFNNSTIDRTIELRVESMLQERLADVLSSVDNLEAFPEQKATYEQLVEAEVQRRLEAIVNTQDDTTALKAQIALLQNQNTQLQEQLAQTNTDMQSFMDFMFTTLSIE
jgi:hypothetical protein